MMILALVLSVGAGFSPPEVKTAQDAVARLRTLNRQQDFPTAAEEGKAYVKQFSDALDVRAWYVVSLADSDDSTSKDESAAMVKEHPESPWSWFARTTAMNNAEEPAEAIAASDKMMALAKNDMRDEFVIARAQALAWDKDRLAEAVALLDARLPAATDRVAILVARGTAQTRYGMAKGESFEAALKSFEEARKENPNDIPALTEAGAQLVGARRVAEGYPLVKRAVELAPGSVRVHRLMWRAVSGLPDRTPEQKRQEIETDMDVLRKTRGDTPATLVAIAWQYYTLELDDKAKALEDQVLRDAPASREADLAMLYRSTRISQRSQGKWAKDPAILAEIMAAIRAYIAYPYHPDPELVREAWRRLFSMLRKDTKSTDAELLEAYHHMQGGTPNPVWQAMSVAVLADRDLALDEAERAAREAIPAVKADDERIKLMMSEGDDFAKLTAYHQNLAHDALGWVLFKRKKMAEAKKELLVAYAAKNDLPQNLYHLGRYYEARGALTKAEEYYAKGKFLQSVDANPNGPAFEALYKRRHGSMKGFDAYAKSLQSNDSTSRKAKVLANRIKSPRSPLPFRLKTLSGQTVSLDDLKGKVAVVNFWGVWCTWCLREMGDIEALSKKYANDPKVRVLTVATDQDPDTPRKWMAEKKYDFAVLLDDGWAHRSGVQGYPTTWFLDPKGRIAFEKLGWSEKLLEEFGWRIDALR